PLGALYRSVFGHAAKAIAISRFTRDLLLSLGVPDGSIAIVHPGVDPAPSTLGSDPERTRAELDLPGGPIVLTVGRLIARKGHRTLFEAMALVRERHPDVVWAVVGRGPLEAELRQRVRA